MDQPVEGRQQCGPPAERPVEVGRIDPPLPFTPYDGGFTGVAHDSGFDRECGAGGPGDAEGAQPPFVPPPARFVDRHGGFVRVDARGQVPQPLPPRPPRDGDLPRSTISSSNWLTLRWCVHPDDFHGTAHVSGNSREVSGP